MIVDKRVDIEGISIHAPREGCDLFGIVVVSHVVISIHAPREGCDTRMRSPTTPVRSFQSTHPVRGATRGHDVGDEITAYFNPRTP